ncbi:DUF3558 domain-containing protein [Amycolatopsis benzoatilytica]|uniref:DUF3558 domain-containing protein n=1 Tax=Amycolatopsis benzoatilytica TaxID=346045 RepID=UPI001B7FD031|nr:DUF3558 domain-containing protein [Amycolatopsis benzoatilytica]
MKRVLSVLACAALAGLAGCSGTTGGAAGPARTPGQSAPSAAPTSAAADQVPGPGVPKVENPIDTDKFKKAPCDTLTPAQADSLVGKGVTPKTDLKAPAGPACAWHSQAHIIVVFPNVDNLGLTSVYRAKGTTYPLFMPLDPIDGYPIVAYGQVDERASEGRCDVEFGTSDREGVVVSISQSPEKKGSQDPCQSARSVAQMVLGNLKGGQ